MRIALVIPTYDALGGGAERWTADHARRLLAQGNEVHLVAERFHQPPDGAKCHRIDTRLSLQRLRRLRFADQAQRVLQSLRVDCIHDMGEGWYADVLMPHQGTRYAVYEQNSLLTPAWRRWLRQPAFWLLPRYAEFRTLERLQYTSEPGRTYVAVSNMVAGHLRHYHNVAPERIRVIYNGVDIHRFRPCAAMEARCSLRQQLGFGAHDTVFCLAAYNFRLKGLDTVLAALSRLLSAGRSVGLTVLGAGGINRYQRIARKLRCEHVVRFVGDQADPVPYYHAADVYVQPSFYDSCSLVALEALASGLPVITSRFNGAGELITQGQEGFVIADPRDDAALAEAMMTTLDPTVRRTMSSAARALAERHSHQRQFDELLNLYCSIKPIRQAG